jgi:hypothetical protein
MNAYAIELVCIRKMIPGLLGLYPFQDSGPCRVSGFTCTHNRMADITNIFVQHQVTSMGERSDIYFTQLSRHSGNDAGLQRITILGLIVLVHSTSPKLTYSLLYS